MTRTLTLLSTTALVAALALPSAARAADDKMGIYVTPSLGISFTQLRDLRVTDNANNVVTQNFARGDDDDTAFRVGLAAGFDLKKLTGLPVRVELDGAWRNRVDAKGTLSYSGDTYSEAHTLKVNALSGLVNAFYDLPVAGRFGVYGGGGIGIARLQVKSTFTGTDSALPAGFNSASGSLGNKTETNFAWQLGLGATYSLNKTLTVDLGYRYFDLGDVKTGATNSFTNLPMQGRVKLTGHDIVLGLRVGF